MSAYATACMQAFQVFLSVSLLGSCTSDATALFKIYEYIWVILFNAFCIIPKEHIAHDMKWPNKDIGLDLTRTLEKMDN